MSDFIVSMTFTALNSITPVLTEINAQLDALKVNMASLKGATAAVGDAAGLTAIEKGAISAGNATKEAAKQAKELKKGFTAISHVGIGMTAAGAVLGYGIVKGLDMAGELQSTLVTIQDTTGATTKQMQALNDTILNTSANVSRFTDLDVAGFAQQLSSGGLGSVKNVQSLLMPMTQFADAQMYEGKVGSGSDAVNMAINMAHLLGHYDPQSLMKSLNTFNQYSTMEPGSSDDLYQTLKYLAPTSRMLHMDETSTMQMAALANRVGLNGTHGGTNAADMILRLIPGYVNGMSGKPSASVMSAMQQLGMVNSAGQSQFFKNGQIVNFPQMVQTLINDSKKFNPEQLTKLYAHVFGIQGGRAATLFSNPQILEQLQGMVNQLHQTRSIPQIQKDQQNTPQGQLNELKSNSTTAMIRVAQQLGTAMNPFLHSLNAALSSLLKLEAQHPKVLKFIAVFTSIAAAVLLTVGPMLMLVGGVGKLALFFGKGGDFLKGWEIIKRISGATKIWAGIQWVLNAAMDANPIGIIILAVAALIPVVILLVNHWKTVVKWVQEAVRWFSNLSPAAKIVITALMPIVGIPLLIMSNWKPISAFFTSVFNTIISWIQSAWKWYQNLGDKVKWLIAIFAPFIGIPLLIISKWQPLVAFFTNLWNNVLQPIVNGIGKLAGGALTDFEKFFHIGNWQGSTPVLAGAGGGNVSVTNHYYIQSTNPQGVANEVNKTQQKYIKSRYPISPPQ